MYWGGQEIASTSAATNHDDCPDASSAPQLTRVIEILDDSRLRLAHGKPDGRYADSSYCWGEGRQLWTTRETLASKCKGFKVTSLPKTLRGTVLPTQALGQQYFWIDSLCIIQDDGDDKDRELTRMAKYYTRAFITICASDENWHNAIPSCMQPL